MTVPAPLSPAAPPAPRSRREVRRSLAWRLAFWVVGVAALVACLFAGFMVLLGLMVAPYRGAELVLIGLRVAQVTGWFAAFGWLIRELARGRWRFVLAPVAAWVWTFVVLALIARNGYANIGY